MYSLEFEIVLLALLTIKYLGFWLVVTDRGPAAAPIQAPAPPAPPVPAPAPTTPPAVKAADADSAARQPRARLAASAAKTSTAVAETSGAAESPEVYFKAYICASPPALGKLISILKAMPSYLKPELVQLFPTLLHVTEHTNAARALLNELAVEVRANPTVEVSLRLAVFAALG